MEDGVETENLHGIMLSFIVCSLGYKALSYVTYEKK